MGRAATFRMVPTRPDLAKATDESLAEENKFGMFRWTIPRCWPWNHIAGNAMLFAGNPASLFLTAAALFSVSETESNLQTETIFAAFSRM